MECCLTKNDVRKKLLKLRDNFKQNPELQFNVINNFIQFSKHFLKPGDVVACYYPIASELNIHPLFPLLHQQHLKIALPVIENESTINFSLWAPEEKMVSSKYATKILEPLNKNILEEVPAIIIAPLIACDFRGNRIGSGKGYYDRKISQLRSKTQKLIYVGLCYDFQIVEFPVENHDQKLNIIITETKIIVI